MIMFFLPCRGRWLTQMLGGILERTVIPHRMEVGNEAVHIDD
jgi:hypothetical protein